MTAKAYAYADSTNSTAVFHTLTVSPAQNGVVVSAIDHSVDTRRQWVFTDPAALAVHMAEWMRLSMEKRT